MRIGLISDTHGLLRASALDALEGCRHILHAGDIGTPAVLEGLRELAPVSAIRGNVDRAHWAEPYAHTLTLELAAFTVHLVHDRNQLDVDLDTRSIDVVVSGHSHKPVIERTDRVLYVNPGSAGPRRFRLPIAVGLLELTAQGVSARIVELGA
jgi:putative phosphoesterase